ncbi:MAG: hypothetical protein ACQETB_09615 [Halobacteriota archaeon]
MEQSRNEKTQQTTKQRRRLQALYALGWIAVAVIAVSTIAAVFGLGQIAADTRSILTGAIVVAGMVVLVAAGAVGPRGTTYW